MKYVGSKRRIAKDILPIMLSYRKCGQYWVEPFCGSCSIIQEVNNPRLAADNNYYLIQLLEWIEKGWIPPDNVSEEEYQKIKKDIKDGFVAYSCSPWYYAYVGFVGFCCSFSGKFWGGYARGNDNKGKPRNYCMEQKKNIMRQAPKLKGIEFRCCNYKDLIIPPNSLVYADPPYLGTTKYSTSKGFEHNEFWDWCRKQYSLGHTLFISEYVAPPDFICVWQKKIYSSLDLKGGKDNVEKLFVPEEQLTKMKQKKNNMKGLD